MLKKIYKKIFIVILILLFNCKYTTYQLMEPGEFTKIIEEEVHKHYYFDEKITQDDYLRTILKLEPNLQNVTKLNAKDYFIELLRENYKNSKIEIAENYYRKAVYELLRNLKGRNLYIVPGTVQLSKDKDNIAGTGFVLYEESIGKFFILDVLEGSPAYISGITPNQYLQEIDGTPIDNFFLEDVVSRLKGKINSKVEVNIQGNHYVLTRNEIKFPPIRKTQWSINNKNVLYLQIRLIVNGVAQTIKQIIFENPNPDYIVLDIRYLSYGEIEEILKVVDLFIGKNELIKIHLKNTEPSILSTNEDIYYTGKILVLHQSKTTPFAYAMARLLANNPDVQILGIHKNIPVYIGKEIPIQKDNINYGSLYLTNGYLEFLQETNIQQWIPIESFISMYPPSEIPNEDDPYHKKILEILSKK